MYITATRAFLPPEVPILTASHCIPRVGYLSYGWAFPSVRKAGAYVPVLCVLSLN